MSVRDPAQKPGKLRILIILTGVSLKNSIGLTAVIIGISLLHPFTGMAAQDTGQGRQEKIALGLKHDTARALYEALREQAGGGRKLSWSDLPDWSGLYSRDLTKGILFDQEQPDDVVTSAKLTPEFQKKLDRKIAAYRQGLEYDPISDCQPPGFPRWLTSPFLREHIVTPGITYLISEVDSSVRRIYTDGRDHPPPEEAYPLYFGDSIGFWDGDRLVIHTTQLMAGQYTRNQPDYSEEVETVEIWHEPDEERLVAEVWIYDPPALLEPWYSRHTYYRVEDAGKSLRIRHWYCAENPNNRVFEGEDGSSQFDDFTFDDE